ncbi:hypothetical protein VP1G_06191 [Cytospora mali]|uniref:Rhodopsin domain-containing protein n=1 Tax=Cytospora mali TaxID=578113 RepID=A0A194V4S1_CYTMA|nr:hypothetical protein VP1G_06191 [Valsa mali var. pyri (nom. inval.)]
MSASPTSSDSFSREFLKVDNGGRVIAACTVILIITTILFPLRLYARSLTSAPRAWDDHVLIPSYVFLLGLIASVYAEVTQAGLGRHTVAVMTEDPNMVSKYLQLLYILDWFYVPSNMLSRISVVFLYLRIFTDRWARAACWAVMGFLVANCLATIIAAQLECTPLAYIWDKTIGGGKCFDQLLWYQLSNFPNIAGDVMIAMLPIRTVWGLRASTARKAGIATVCLAGSIGLVASCVRTSVFYTQAGTILNDPTFCDEAFSWTVVECGMYFSAACLIGMRPLFARLPTFVKVHLLHVSDDIEGGSKFGHLTPERLHSEPHHYKSEYASMQDGEDTRTDLQHQGPEGVVMVPLPGEHAHKSLVGGVSNRSEIRVETNIVVRSDLDQSYIDGNTDYVVPIHANQTNT